MRTSAFIAALVLAAGVCQAAETPEELLKQAYQLEKSGDTAKAAGVFDEFLRKYPDHTQVVDVHYRLAKALESLGALDDCIKHLQVATQSEKKQFRNRQDAFFMLGKLYASVKKYDEAIATFEKMLADGAGLYEDEVQSLCSGYYALKGKYDEAAAKLNILKRKKDSPLAEQAAYKLALLWLKAEKVDLAIAAIEDLAAQYPNNKSVPELLLQLADLFRKQQKFDKAISVSEQLKARYPKTVEAMAGSYILGMCARDRKDFTKAIEVFDRIGKTPEFQKRGLAAEAVLQSADIYFSELGDMPKAVERYEEAAKLARECDSERKSEILEQCYFRIGEYYFRQKKWGPALESYMQLRQLGTRLNITGRILTCQAALDEAGTSREATYTEEDLEQVRKKVAANAGTVIAAEGEVFLADRKLSEAIRTRKGFATVVSDYEGILKKYPRDILAQGSLESYIHLQIGMCHGNGVTRDDCAEAVKAFEQALAIDANTPYKLTALENIAIFAERAGDKKKSYDTYEQLWKLAAAQEPPDRKPGKSDLKSLDYLKAMITRADSGDLTERSIAILQKLIAEKGQLSDEAREARFYIAELSFVKKDYSAAAKAYREYIQIYGPKLDANGDVAGGPWKPQNVDAKVLQVYEAAVRVAHCWYVQGHEQNMVKAYEWLVKNMSHQDKYVAEAQYWLAMEAVKGEKGQSKDAKRAAAEALWRNVVSPSLGLTDRKHNRQFHAWVSREPQYADVQHYVKTAMLKAGQFFSEGGDHQSAAGCFAAYIDRYPIDLNKHNKPQKKGKSDDSEPPDEMYQVARYALGREYIALGDTQKMIELYKPCISGLRDDKFRPSALKLLGYHAGKAECYDEAIEAYATLLDEYGPPAVDGNNSPAPLPKSERLRQSSHNWDGLRMDPPKDLDLGEIRYALSFLYWKQEQWEKVVRTLSPFLDDPALRENKSREKALFMAGQSAYNRDDHAGGVKLIHALIREHPKFEAIEEAYVYAATGYCETKNWPELELIYRNFVAEWPNSERRPRMDLYAAMAQVGQGKTDAGVSRLKSLAASDTYEDVRADALYQLAQYELSRKPPATQEAFNCLEKSVQLHARESSCLALAKCCVTLQKWAQANGNLERVTREFRKGRAAVVAEAERLLQEVRKELAKAKQ
ncbi:MAG: tetratricopeptide repeat protein [Planctomycetota bacterium]|nr:tetratricopeptide repeat protein [Planctomycetota bacterium]